MSLSSPVEVLQVDGFVTRNGSSSTARSRSRRPFTPRPARKASASPVALGPLPMIRFAARSEMTEKRRHSSRSSMFERCTSTTGTAKSSSASRIA